MFYLVILIDAARLYSRKRLYVGYVKRMHDLLLHYNYILTDVFNKILIKLSRSVEKDGPFGGSFHQKEGINWLAEFCRLPVFNLS